MTRSVRFVGLLAAFGLLTAQFASAQTTPAPTSTNSSSSDTRPATSTFFGDTGLWFVPTAEVLPASKWSVTGYRRGTNYVQGFDNVVDAAGTFGVGIKNRAEIFGSFLFDTRIERDLRPIFTSDTKVGGVLAQYPFAKSGWSGDQVGDLYLGAKVNVMSQAQQKPFAVAIRGTVKAPTGSTSSGASTGKADGAFDLVLSKETLSHVEFTGFAGYEMRGKPDGVDSPSGAFRWGGGAGFPTRSPMRVSLEIDGTLPNSSTTTITGASIVGVDGSIAPLSSAADSLTRATAGLTWQDRKGFFVGAGVSLNVPMRDRSNFKTDEGATGDFVDWQLRIGYHPGVRIYVPPPVPTPPAPAPPPPVAANRPPTVTAACDPCTVEVGKTSTVTANGQDPDNDPLTYRWSAPSGSFQNPADKQTVWTAPQQEGPVVATVTVNDGKGGTASASVTIQVVRPPAIVELTFEDVYFDFDRSTLRPEALRLLDDAVTKLQANPTKNLIIEGHTCSIGTAEYNLALGDRRARSVMTYLASRGVAAGRLEVVSYGEERPKFDNAREETRRLNRRAALVVKVQ